MDAQSLYPAAKSHTRRRLKSDSLGDLGAILWPIALLMAALVTSDRLLAMVPNLGVISLPALGALITLGVEAVALWFTIWSLLALASTLRFLPGTVRSALSGSVFAFGTAGSRRIAHRTIAATAVAGSTLVAPVALAADPVVSPDDLLWETGVTQTENQHSAAEDPPRALEVWLPGETLELVATDSMASRSVEPTKVEPEPANQDFAAPHQPPAAPHQPPAGSLPIRPSNNIADAQRAAPKNLATTAIEQLAQRHHSPANITPGAESPAATVVGDRNPIDAVFETREEGTGTSATGPSAEDPAHPKTHTVAQGDCLWDIAEALLPDGASISQIEDAWKAIYQLNIEVIGGNPDLIHPGQTLNLPSFLAK